ncbi:hypothetical protein ACFL6F_01030 [Planctomycetota bacterium]
MIEKLYTKAEVIEILRLDQKQVKNPRETLKYLVRTGQIQAIKIAGVYMFTEQSIQNYIDYCTVKA